MTLVLPYPQIEPELFTIPLGGYEFSLRWYALAYIAGLLIGWRQMVLLMRRPKLWPADKAPMTQAQPEELLTRMILGVVLGGRLGYVLFYDLDRFLDRPGEILRIWEGGMSFHGGFAGVILGTILYTWRNKLSLLQAGDAVALAAPAGLFLGRIANLINGELWGRVSDVPWAMVFPGAGPEPRHPSQLYEAALEGLVLGAVMWGLALKGGWLKRPGAIIGMFFIGYGLARSIVEYFRQWDPQLSELVAATGFTMGQVLSLPMVLIGLGFLWQAWRRQAG